jgi:hypothetical protein
MGSPRKPPSIFTRSNQSNQQHNNPKNLILTKPRTYPISCALLCVAVLCCVCAVLCAVCSLCCALPLPLPCPCRVSRVLPTYLSTYLPPVSRLSRLSRVSRVLPISRLSRVLPPVPSVPSVPIRLSCFRPASLLCPVSAVASVSAVAAVSIVSYASGGGRRVSRAVLVATSLVATPA